MDLSREALQTNGELFFQFRNETCFKFRNKPLLFFHRKYFPIFFLFLFLEKSNFSAFVGLEKFQPCYLRSELGSHKLLHLCMDCHEVCFK